MKGLARVAVVSCLFVNAAWADGDESKPPMYGAAMGSYLLPDSVRQDTNGFGGHLVFGLPLTQSLNLEINGFGTALSYAHFNGIVVQNGQNRQISNAKSDGQFGLGADLRYGFGHGKLEPFVLAGVGGEWETFYDTQAENKLGPFADVGAGVLYKLTSHWALRGEARYYATYEDSYAPRVLGDARFNLGIQYAFFKNPAPPPPAPSPPPPPPAPLAKPKCPPAPPGFKVDADGCVVEQTIIFRGVNFQYNKDQLTPGARDTLDQVGTSLIAQPELYVQIDGFTDSIGTDAYNLKLSEERAQSVRSYLVGKGVKGDHLSAKGYGKAKPVATNKTPEGRAENRRVEFTVLNKPPAIKVIEKAPTEASKSEAEHGEPARLRGDEKSAPVVPNAKKKAKASPKPAAVQ